MIEGILAFSGLKMIFYLVILGAVWQRYAHWKRKTLLLMAQSEAGTRESVAAVGELNNLRAKVDQLRIEGQGLRTRLMASERLNHSLEEKAASLRASLGAPITNTNAGAVDALREAAELLTKFGDGR